MNINRRRINKVFNKKIVSLVLMLIIIAGTLPSRAEQHPEILPVSNPKLGHFDGQVWLLDQGYLTTNKDKKNIIKVSKDGSRANIFEGSIGQIWQGGNTLYFVNLQSLAVVALDLKTLEWENRYYLTDLSIALSWENLLVMNIDKGLRIIDLETQKETQVQGTFTKLSPGENSFYGINENQVLCQIGLEGTVLEIGSIGVTDHFHLNQKIYILDETTGKLKSTPDTISYRAVTDTKVVAIEARSTELIFFEEGSQKTLSLIDGESERVQTIKIPFQVKDFDIQGDWLLVSDANGGLWKSSLSLWKKTSAEKVSKFEPILDSLKTTEDSNQAKGILTFRGSNLRQNSAYGVADIQKKALKKMWSIPLPAGDSKWGGGAGWTGQPLLVQWPQKVKTHMNIASSHKKNPNFVEVIQASLNGNVYFVDMATGKATRPPIKIGNPIKGTSSVDGRGLPLLYVGDGIPYKNKAGFRIFSLIDQKELFFQNGLDTDSTRKWPSFDSSAVFDTDHDQLIVGGENGILYQFKLNTKFNDETGALTLAPTKKVFKAKLSYSKDGKVLREGIENSIAYYDNHYYFATNSGQVRCVDQNMKLLWEVNNYDDTDASVTLDIENGKPVLYTASEVDLQGEKGLSRILKIDGKTGKVLWKKAYTCYSKFGESPSNGGALATNIVGKNDIENVVIFNLARCEKPNQGSLIALNKKTGKQVWRKNMSTYAWSSPVAIYDNKGKSYILQNDRSGTVHLFEGVSGKEVWTGKVDTYLEATPAVFNNTIVFSSRTGKMYCYEIM